MKNQQHILIEGVTYDADKGDFVFDFSNDAQTRNVSIRQNIHQINAFGRCYYYSYEFAPDVDSSLRTQFIKHIKFEENFQRSEDFSLLLNNAIGALDQNVNLPTFKAFVYPKSLSEINRRLMANIARISSPDIIEMEMLKELPQNIQFDYDRFQVEVLDSKLPNGQPRFAPAAQQETLRSINEIMEAIHQKDYFSIARDVKKSKYRNYIKNFYKYPNKSQEQQYQLLTNSNVLLFDDIVTSGTTIYHLLNCLRCINDSNNIVIYSLIGNNKVADIV